MIKRSFNKFAGDYNIGDWFATNGRASTKKGLDKLEECYKKMIFRFSKEKW